MNNQEPRFANQLNIQWFPGHMTKTLRMMEQEIQHVDASLVLLDARIPLSSLNPEIERITARKPKLYALNKADLADPAVTEEWIKYFHAADAGCVAISAKQKGGAKAVQTAIEKELSGLLARRPCLCPLPEGQSRGHHRCGRRLHRLLPVAAEPGRRDGGQAGKAVLQKAGGLPGLFQPVLRPERTEARCHRQLPHPGRDGPLILSHSAPVPAFAVGTGVFAFRIVILHSNITDVTYFCTPVFCLPGCGGPEDMLP